MGNAVKKSEYNAQSIEVLEGLEAVRKRPGMYIAGTDTIEGLHQLFLEVLDNSIDEAMNGHASLITIVLKEDERSISVEDNGRGIPVDLHPKFKKSALELILTTLHAGGKFSDKNYTASGGLHGVGSSVVNALSDNLEATISRDGGQYYQAYKHGVPYANVKKIKSGVKTTGTKIEFTPDYSLFKIKKFSSDYMREKIKIKAFLNPGLTIKYIDESASTEEDFCYKDGLKEFLQESLEKCGSSQVGEPFILYTEDLIPVSIALAWTEDTKEVFYSYVNGIYTPDGGTHEQGVKNGIVKAVRNYLTTHGGIPKGLKIGAEDIREGLLCVLSIKMPSGSYQPQFQGQTKSKLNNPEITPIVENSLKSLEIELNQKPSVAEKVTDRIFLAARARQASRSAVQQVRRKVGLNQRMTLPGKLADCSSNNLADTELFLVEGDSAGGSTKQGRDRHCQAVLALRGKVLNTINSNDKKILENKELGNIVSALGCGIGKEFNIKKLRYGKVVILTDADADGMHIGTLLLAFFYTQMKPLIDEGRLYLGKPPLYGVFSPGVKKKDQENWAYSDSELQKVLKGIKGKPRIVRYKGLGEMNADTLWDTTLDPKKRTLLQISAGDMKSVLAGFESLMGSDSSERYKLIQDNADNLEIDV